MAFYQKRYLYKIYDGSGNYVTTWDDVVSDPEFTININSGAGELKVILARSLNDYGEGDDITLNYQLQLWCFDKDTGSAGTRIYTGYLSKYTEVKVSNKDAISVTFLGYFSEFNRYMYETAGGNTEIAHASVSPQAILQDILDKFTAAGGTPDYDGTSTDNPGTTVSYTYNTSNVLEALEKVIELSPVGWYYYVNGANLVHYHAKSTTADHIFNMGRDVGDYNIEKRNESVVNRVYFVGGDPGGGKVYRKYSNTSSISHYGLHAIKKVDERVTTAATAELMSNRLLEAFITPEVRSTIRIIDNNGNDDGRGYDIENIKVGDTCRVLSSTPDDYSRWDEAVWDVSPWDYALGNVMATVQQIIQIKYTPNYIDIVTSNRIPEIAKRIEDINRNLVDSITKDNPVAPS